MDRVEMEIDNRNIASSETTNPRIEGEDIGAVPEADRGLGRILRWQEKSHFQ